MKKIYLLFLLILISKNTFSQEKYHSSKLSTAASFGAHRPIGVSVNSANRLFVSFPRQNENYDFGLTEIVNGQRIPYPNAQWNTQGSPEDHFVNVQDLFVDALDYLWVLDSKPAPSSSIFADSGNSSQGEFKLLKINTTTDSIERIYTFEDLDKSKSGLNDIRVDTDKKLAYLSDPGQAAIIILDLQTGATRKILEHSPYTLADPAIVLSYQGVEMRNKDGKPFVSNVNGIALTHDFKYFYFKPINHNHLFRIETQFLADTTLPAESLQQHVEDMGPVGVTHGLLADKKGNIYLSTSMDYTIKYITPQGKLHTLIQDSRLLWPDSFGIGSDGYLYFSCAQLANDTQWNNGVGKLELPYRVYKMKLPE